MGVWVLSCMWLAGTWVHAILGKYLYLRFTVVVLEPHNIVSLAVYSVQSVANSPCSVLVRYKKFTTGVTGYSAFSFHMLLGRSDHTTQPSTGASSSDVSCIVQLLGS